MRSTNPNIDVPLGTSPYMKISVNWGGLLAATYATRRVGDAPGKLISIGSLTMQLGQYNSASMGGTSAVVDDNDGSIKAIFNQRLLDGSRCRVYIGFADGGDDMLLLKGRIADVRWTEADRNVSFTIQSDVRGEDVFFGLAEEGLIPNQDPAALDRMWPVCFGRPVHVPAVRVQTPAQGSLVCNSRLQSDILVFNSTAVPHNLTEDTNCLLFSSVPHTMSTGYDNEDSYLYVENGENFPFDTLIKLDVDGCIFAGRFQDNSDRQRFTVTEVNAARYTNIAITPQSSTRVLLVQESNVSLTGHWIKFDDDLWNYVERQDGQKIFCRYDIKNPLTRNVISEARIVQKNGAIVDIQVALRQTQEAYDLAWAKKKSLKQIINSLPNTRDIFWNKPFGTKVGLWAGASGDKYVINAIPSTALRSIYAWRTWTNSEKQYSQREFACVPSNLYTVNLNEVVDGKNCTTVTFQIPLEQYTEQGWEPQIYATVYSSVGQEFPDIAEWLVDNFTDYSLDASHVTTYGSPEKFPMNFALMDRQDSMQLLTDLAWQARCGLILGGEQIKLRYLSRFIADSTLSISQSLIEMNTLEHVNTSRTDVKTVQSGYFRESNHVDTQRKVTFRANEAWFGTQLLERQMYAYNNKSCVEKTIKFWGVRDANIWQLTQEKLKLPAVRLELWDQVTVNDGFTSPSSRTGYVQSWTFDPADWSVALGIWYPYNVGDTLANAQAFMTDTADTVPTDLAGRIRTLNNPYQPPRKALSLEDAKGLINSAVKGQNIVAIATTAQSSGTNDTVSVRRVDAPYKGQAGTSDVKIAIVPTNEKPVANGQPVNVIRSPENDEHIVVQTPVSVFGRLTGRQVITDSMYYRASHRYSFEITDETGRAISGSQPQSAIETTGTGGVPWYDGVVYRFTATSWLGRDGLPAWSWMFSCPNPVMFGKVASNTNGVSLYKLTTSGTFVLVGETITAVNAANIDPTTDTLLLGGIPKNDPSLPDNAYNFPVGNIGAVIHSVVYRDALDRVKTLHMYNHMPMIYGGCQTIGLIP